MSFIRFHSSATSFKLLLVDKCCLSYVASDFDEYENRHSLTPRARKAANGDKSAPVLYLPNSTPNWAIKKPRTLIHTACFAAPVMRKKSLFFIPRHYVEKNTASQRLYTFIFISIHSIAYVLLRLAVHEQFCIGTYLSIPLEEPVFAARQVLMPSLPEWF